MDSKDLFRGLCEEQKRLSMEGRAEAVLGLRRLAIETEEIELIRQRCLILMSAKEAEVIHPYIRKMNELARCE